MRDWGVTVGVSLGYYNSHYKVVAISAVDSAYIVSFIAQILVDERLFVLIFYFEKKPGFMCLHPTKFI